MTADHDRDWHEAEDRDEHGFTPYRSECDTRPRAGLRLAPGAAVGGQVTFNQPTDNSQGKVTNPAIPWIIATGVAALSIGVVLGVVIGQDGRIQAEGRAVRAEVRIDFEERLQNLDARLKVAEYEASIAKTNSQRTDEKLNARLKP